MYVKCTGRSEKSLGLNNSMSAPGVAEGVVNVPGLPASATIPHSAK